MFKYVSILSLLCLLGNICFADDKKTESFDSSITDSSYPLMIWEKLDSKKSPEVIVNFINKDGYDAVENGVLISRRHVLMSANYACYVMKNIRSFRVTAGKRTMGVKSIVAPSNFDCYNPTCDKSAILILTLSGKVKGNKLYRISKSAKRIKKNALVRITGFGGAGDNDRFGLLKWAKTKIEKIDKYWAILTPYLNRFHYTNNEGATIITVQVPNPKNNKKVWAVAAMGTCYNESTNVKKDKVLMLARKDLIKFIKKATEGTAKFI